MDRRHHEVAGSYRCADVSKDVDQDVEAIVWAMGLHGVRRYYQQRFWEAESRESMFAARVESYPRLESVAEHSWHLAYICTILAPRHGELDLRKVLQIATLHDILEIISGDDSPIGRDGTGKSTHAFNKQAAVLRAREEEVALRKYLERLPKDVAAEQRRILVDYQNVESQEARFVKSIDKLQTLVFVLLKKRGEMEDKHLRFTLRYSEKGISYFPPLEDHFRSLQFKILSKAADVRGVQVTELRTQLFGNQLSFWQED